MRYSKPDEDFDQGGSPSWQRRQVNLAALKRRNTPGIVGMWRRASAGSIFLTCFLLAMGLPAAVFFGGLAVAFTWSQITGR